jgi:chromosomal replication initiator protein
VDKALVNIPTERATIDEVIKDKPLFGVTDGIALDLNNAIKRAGLNPSYTFSSFIVGDSNNLSHAAALGVTEKPGTLYNPLFIYGKTGLGKTHLAQAVGRDVLDKNPSKKVFYITSENFMNDMVRAIQTGKNIDFRKKFRTVDILIIDDVQLISKWPKTQEEFFNTFNILYNSQKQIILTSDVSPDRLSDIDDRLKSRFQGGMSVEINRPDLETRYAILQKKMSIMGITIPKKITEYIAREIKDNIRELEGAIQKISLYNSMVNNELSIEEVAKILGRDTKSKRDKIKVPTVFKRVAKEFDVTVKDIKSPKRHANVAFARQVCMYLLREEFKYKLEQTAQLLNRKDHTTVIHAVDKIKSKTMIDEGFKDQINIIIQDLESQNL